MIRLLQPLAHEGDLVVEGEAHHYLVHVHRMREGDTLEAFDGRGSSFAGRVKVIGPDSLTLELGPALKAEPVRPVFVLQGMPKGDKLELVIQKCAELLATAVVPVFCERSVVKSSSTDEKKQQRWQKIADEAARQCGRSEVMKVELARPLSAALELDASLLVLDEAEDARTLSQAVKSLAENRALALVIGPEGGFSDAERALLAQAGAKSVTLGRLVLRTETASLAALSVVRHLDGLLG